MPDLYSFSDCIVGTGRVALEALACNRAVIAVGTAGIFGILNRSNFYKSWKYYFGDHKSIRPFNQKEIVSLVRAAIRSYNKSKKWSTDGRYLLRNILI